MHATQGFTHYDRTSNAEIPGFDHFCVFLNVAVGARTYFFFYMLAMSGFFQFLWQTVALALVAGGPWRENGLSDGLIALAAIGSLLGGAGLFCFTPLFFFHK